MFPFSTLSTIGAEAENRHISAIHVFRSIKGEEIQVRCKHGLLR